MVGLLIDHLDKCLTAVFFSVAVDEVVNTLFELGRTKKPLNVQGTLKTRNLVTGPFGSQW